VEVPKELSIAFKVPHKITYEGYGCAFYRTNKIRRLMVTYNLSYPNYRWPV
jgi:hypothetical protein